jgi:hypothetical protein
MTDQTIILGGPGTGKTTKLMSMIEEELAGGTNPERIALCSFTTKAASEAVDRACEKFGLSDKKFPWFRTIHSAAFRLIGANRGQMMNFSNYKQIGELLGLKFSFKAIDAEEAMSSAAQTGDKFLFLDGLARNRMVSLRDQWQEFDGELDWFGLELFSKTLKEYKQRTGLYDFTDLLEQCLEQKKLVDVDVAIIDEAQDLSRLQWAVVDQIFSDVPRKIIAGDDDQAIYRWGGADVEEFLAMPGKQIVLEKSYRLPEAVFDFGQKIINNVDNRIQKNYKPRAEQGDVITHFFLDEVKVTPESGTWLMLARNAFFLDRLEELATASGMLFRSRKKNSVDRALAEAIYTWEAMRKGKKAKGKDIRKIYSLLGAGQGVAKEHKSIKIEANKSYTIKQLQMHFGLKTDDVWFKAFAHGMTFELIEYYRSVMRSGEKLLDEPKIIIDTIHGVQ